MRDKDSQPATCSHIEKDNPKSGALHLQQSHCHNACRPYQPWQHAAPQQNGQEQLAPDKSQVENVETAACADQKRTAIIPPTVAKRHSAMLCACDILNKRGCPGTMQGTVMGAAQMLM